MSLSYREVAEIMKIIDASSLDEVILEVDGAKLVVRRGAAGDAASAPANGAGKASRSPAATSETRSQASASASASAAASTADAPAVDGDTVCAPMVGTFYRAPAPGEAPFVEVGSTVSVGDPLCLIEVMKLYTTIEATVAGTIEQVLVDDATLVEFDQPLFAIRAA